MIWDSRAKSLLRRRLLRWFDLHQRDLPWRQNSTPYRVWVSEIMLQQTQVPTVLRYYDRFMSAFPDVQSLAAADVQQVLGLWEGLGYYRRARQMHRAAQVIVEEHQGRFPEALDEVLKLPGIGRYTAGAILSISLDQRQPILEGNTIRLLARLMEMNSDPRTTANQKALWEFSESLLPRKRCGDFNQALMELGSEVCSPRNPQCTLCPLKELCPTAVKGLQQQIPVSGKRTEYVSKREAVVLVERRNRFLVRRCRPDQRWAGLWDFPRFELADLKQPPEQRLSQELRDWCGLEATLVDTGWQTKHAVTKYRIQLGCYRATGIRGRLHPGGLELEWVSPLELAELPMNVTGRKIVEQLEVVAGKTPPA